MARTIYTERDIEDLARRGGTEIVIGDEVYLTDVARERAEKLGIALRVGSAPVAIAKTPAPSAPNLPRENTEAIIAKVKADVLAKLGNSVDAAMIEKIVRRIVSQLQ